MQIADVRGTQIKQTFIVFRSPKDVEKFRPHAVRAVASVRKEEGCVGYAIGVDPLDDRTMRIYGRWRSEAAFQAHSGSAHRAALIDALQALDPFTFRVKLFTPHETIGGHSLGAGDEIKVLSPEEEAQMGPRERMQQLVQVVLYFSSGAECARFLPMGRHSMAVSRKQAGNLEYGWAQDVDDPSILRLAERWTNVATMFRHIKSKDASEGVNLLRREFDMGRDSGGELFYIAPEMEFDLPLEGA